MTIDGFPLVGLTAPTLLLLGLLLVYTGRLVPRSTVVDMRSGYVAQIDALREERDMWRGQALEARAQVTALLPAVDVSATVLEELREQAQTRPPRIREAGS